MSMIAAGMYLRTLREGLSSVEWQAGGFIVNLPRPGPAAGIVLSEIHGRCGHFPAQMTLRREDDGTFHVSEIINLQKVREAARWQR